jgi:signal transduction histidine kinase
MLRVEAARLVIAPIHILLVEDSSDDARLVTRALVREHPEIVVTRVEGADELRAALGERQWDIVLSDWAMPGFGALAALTIVRALRPALPFIIVSGTIGEELAVVAMRAGANDYVLKDKLARLAPAIEREIRDARLREGTGVALRAAEEQLRQAQKMEAVGRLAGGVAHDFNNALSVILSYAEMLKEELEPGDPKRETVGEICLAGWRAASLTRQLLMFSRQQILEPAIVDLNTVLSSMERMLRRVLGEDVELVTRPAKTLGKCKADPSSIEQVIMNLVVNARDAMPTGGKLTLETANVTLDDSDASQHGGATAGPHVMLAVTDSGTGMDRATQARIFEPFFTTKAKDKGTGLGLSTVFGIAQQSGGSVSVYSEPGLGSTFKVYLPCVDAGVQRKHVVRPSAAGGSETVLLVEDEGPVRVVAHEILRRHGYTVLEARDAIAALAFGDKHPGTIDLLLTDVVMPQLSGPELVKRLLVMRPGLRVLFMSGYTDDGVVRHGILDSEVAFVQKPFTPESLARKVRETLDALT